MNGSQAHRAASYLHCVQLLGDTHGAGAENQVRYLLGEMRGREGFDVELAYFTEGRAHTAFVELDVPMRNIPRKRRLRFDIPGRVRRLRQAYARRPPDVLHTWLLEANIIGLIAGLTWPSTAIVIGQRGSKNEFDYPVHTRLQRLLIRRADCGIANSEEGASSLERMGLPRERIFVVPNGIPAERVRVEEDAQAVRARLGWEGRPIVIWVGRASNDLVMRQKDFGLLLKAVAKLRECYPSALLALVGISKEEARTRGFDLPSWAVPLGWTARVADYVNAADLLAISSRAEGHSNAAGEALMLGVPVVTTACGGHCDAVEAAAGGRVVPIGNVAALTSAMGSMLESPPQRALVGEKARELLAVERMVDRTVAVYREAVARRNGTAPNG